MKALGARGGRWALGSVLGAFLIAAVVAGFHDDNRLVGMQPLPPMGAAAAVPGDGVPPDEWHAYGRTGHGQRYSPLAQITPANVKSLALAWNTAPATCAAAPATRRKRRLKSRRSRSVTGCSSARRTSR